MYTYSILVFGLPISPEISNSSLGDLLSDLDTQKVYTSTGGKEYTAEVSRIYHGSLDHTPIIFGFNLGDWGDSDVTESVPLLQAINFPSEKDLLGLQDLYKEFFKDFLKDFKEAVDELTAEGRLSADEVVELFDALKPLTEEKPCLVLVPASS